MCVTFLIRTQKLYLLSLFEKKVGKEEKENSEIQFFVEETSLQ